MTPTNRAPLSWGPAPTPNSPPALAPSAVAIISQPASTTVNVGRPATFTVEANRGSRHAAWRVDGGGNEVWLSRFGSQAGDAANAIAVAADGNAVYGGGVTNGDGFDNP